MSARRTVILTRYSSKMQRPASCEDQERNVRRALPAKGVNPIRALVLHDRAESGTLADRPVMQELHQMIDRGRIGVLAVDDQGRFSRGDNVFQLITDLVYSGARFISTGDGVDTDEAGWELKVQMLGFHNSTTIRELGRRVRRGQEGRVLDGNGSAGDYGYGYRTEFADPNHTEWTGRGPKPKKIVVIYDPEARVVRMIFAWFVGGMSINAIARKLNDLGVDKGHRSWKSGWRHQIVRRILGNAKYIGQWTWGRTTTRRNSRGKKKQVLVDESLVAHKDRPDLRIIDDAIWQETQKLLAELQETYGKTQGGPSRKARVHHTELYPSSLLSGLVFCGACNSRMTIEQSGRRKYLGCPKHRRGECRTVARVPLARAEHLVVELIGGVLASNAEWIETVIASMRRTLVDLSSAVPASLAADEKQLEQVERQLSNLLDVMAQGLDQSQIVRDRFEALEGHAANLRQKIADQRQLLDRPTVLPNDAWIQGRLADLASVLQVDDRGAALRLRRLIPRITAHEIKIRGKKRGFTRLHVRIDALGTLAEALADQMPAGLAAAMSGSGDWPSGQSPEFELDLGGPSRLDRLAPKIADLREQGVPWNEIARITGVGAGNAWTAWRRWIADADDDQAVV